MIKVSVGIPAYNEEKNIEALIESVINQKVSNYELREIIIFSDGSTDNTVDLVKSINFPKIKLIESEERIGQQVAQNKILDTYEGDILVFIEADTLPVDSSFLGELVKPFVENKIENLGMVTGGLVVLKPSGFYEKVVYFNNHIKRAVYDSWKGGNNIYNYSGHSAKALSKDFSESLRYPKNVPEDAYTYLKLKEIGFTSVKQSKAKIYSRSVTNVGDRVKQVNKFLTGRASLCKYFGMDTIKLEYTVPKRIVMDAFIDSFFKDPICTVAVLFELVLTRLATLKSKINPIFDPLYDPYLSSKDLVIGGVNK